MRTCRHTPLVYPLNASGLSLLAAHGITMTALTPLGAAVKGLDLRKKPPEPVLEELQSQMATRGFLVFKDQGVLSGDEQVAASEFWGGRKIHSTHGVHPKAPNEHIFRLSNDRQVGILGVGPQWHNDGSFERGVFSHVGYHIVRVAEGGGGTIFSHQGAAFDALPEAEQERWQRLVSINSNSGVLHPVVHEHPISKRKTVYLHLGMTGGVFEVTPDPANPGQAKELRLLEQDEMRHLFQSYNALLNAGFAPGSADLLGAAPTYGSRVEVFGLSAKPELNGRVGKVIGVLDRTNGRVAVELDAQGDGDDAVPSRQLAIKPANLLVTTASPVSMLGGGGADTAAVDLADGDAAAPSNGGDQSAKADSSAAGTDADAAAAAAYTMVYEYEEGDCIFIDVSPFPAPCPFSCSCAYICAPPPPARMGCGEWISFPTSMAAPVTSTMGLHLAPPSAPPLTRPPRP